MKKTIIALATFLPLVSFAQEATTLHLGKSHNCLSMGRGCLHKSSDSMTFDVEKIEGNIITLSISTIGLSEEDQFFLIGDQLTNLKEESFFSQEEDYDFTKFSTFGVKGNNPRGAIVIGADAAGTIIGGGLGAAGGSFLGPAVSIGGWFGGAAAGAWSGSGSAATAIAIYDYIFN